MTHAPFSSADPRKQIPFSLLVNGRRFPRHQIDDPSPLLLVDHLVQDFLSGAVLVFRLLILGVFAAIQNAGVLLLFGNERDSSILCPQLLTLEWCQG